MLARETQKSCQRKELSPRQSGQKFLIKLAFDLRSKSVSAVVSQSDKLTDDQLDSELFSSIVDAGVDEPQEDLIDTTIHEIMIESTCDVEQVDSDDESTGDSDSILADGEDEEED